MMICPNHLYVKSNNNARKKTKTYLKTTTINVKWYLKTSGLGCTNLN